MSRPQSKSEPRSLRVYLAQLAPEVEDEFLAATLRSEKLHSPWVLAPRTHEQFAGQLERLRTGRTHPLSDSPDL